LSYTDSVTLFVAAAAAANEPTMLHCVSPFGQESALHPRVVVVVSGGGGGIIQCCSTWFIKRLFVSL
jgi:hypothetical protein